MALRVRHKELGSTPLTKARKQREIINPYLVDLLNWAEQTGLIEDTDDRPSWREWDKKRTDVLRELRNMAVHADASTLHGVSIVGLLYRVVDFVNELYQDPRLRKVRHEYERTFQNLLTRITANGAILESDNNRLIVFHAEVLHAVQVKEDWDIYLGLLRIFHPEPDERGVHVLPEPIFLNCRNYEANDDMALFGTLDGNGARLHAICDEANGELFRTFKSSIDKNSFLLATAFRPLADQRNQLKRKSLSD